MVALLTICVMIPLYFLNSATCQRVPPGVPPQHYQPNVGNQQYQQVPMQQQQQQQHVPMQQHQVPVQQIPVQQQVPMQQQQMPNHQQMPVQQQHQVHHGHHGQPNQILHNPNLSQEKQHIAEHMDVPIDTSKMSEQELQFHYFKMHDADNNNKLDGCELIKSLIHWHEQGNKEKQGEVDEKIFKDDELLTLIDPILNVDDTNRDGYIDYPEFIRAQQKAAATAGKP